MSTPNDGAPLDSTPDELEVADETIRTDAEALGDERDEYPDPEAYPLPDPAEMADGDTPDADLQVDPGD